MDFYLLITNNLNMVNWIWIGYIILVLILIGIFVIGYATVDWEQILTGRCEFDEMICTVLVTVGFPGGWLNPANIIWRCIVPLVGVGLVFYGFLSKVGIFGRGVNIALALVAALSTVPVGAFVVFVAVLYAVMGIYSVILFGALIFMAISLSFMRTASMKATGMVFKEADKQIGEIRKKKDYYRKEIEESWKRINEIKRKRDAGQLRRFEANQMIEEETARIKECEKMQKTCDEAIKQVRDQAKDIKEDVEREQE